MKFLRCLIILLCFVAPAYAQWELNDLDLIEQKAQQSDVVYLKDIHYQKHSHANELSKGQKLNPVLMGFRALIRLYQNIVSHQLGRSCVYELSCARFAQECIQRWGPFKGVLLAADRLQRCQKRRLKNQDPILLGPKGKLVDNPKWYGKKK